MATRLRAFVTGVSAILEAAGTYGGLTMVVGRKSLSHHESKVRVGWVMPGGRFVPPEQAAARMPTGQTSTRVSICKTNEARVLALIHGGSDEATELLMEAIVAAVCEKVQGQCEMPGWRWVTQEAESSAHIIRTEYIELTILLRLPVVAEVGALRAIESVEDTCGLLDGTEDEWTIGEEA